MPVASTPSPIETVEPAETGWATVKIRKDDGAFRVIRVPRGSVFQRRPKADPTDEQPAEPVAS